MSEPASEPTAQRAVALRELFLFEKLTDDQLAWVAGHAADVEFPAGADITEFAQGKDGKAFAEPDLVDVCAALGRSTLPTVA